MFINKSLTTIFFACLFAFSSFANAAIMPLPLEASTLEEPVDNALDLNKATIKQLLKVKGINASRARAIIAYRKKHGEFKGFYELSKVRGFQKLKAEQLKEIQGQLRIG